MFGESNPSCKVRILDVALKTARIKLDPGVILNHSQQIKETPAIYVIDRSNVTQNIIPKGSIEFYWDSMYPKSLPSKVLFGLISQKTANGNYTAN